jgi:hypothetical protein
MITVPKLKQNSTIAEIRLKEKIAKAAPSGLGPEGLRRKEANAKQTKSNAPAKLADELLSVASTTRTGEVLAAHVQAETKREKARSDAAAQASSTARAFAIPDGIDLSEVPDLE